MLQIQHICKEYRTGNLIQKALDDVSLNLRDNEFVAILGPSGSGKTTLLNILASLDTPTAGKVLVDGKDFTTLKDNERAIFRRSNLGFIFQDFNLLDNFSIEDNIKLPFLYAGFEKKNLSEDENFEAVVSAIGIKPILKKKPLECSGGERARAVFARGIIMKPQIILADEPTASLDMENRERIVTLLFRMNKEFNTTIITVTHDLEIANRHDRVIHLERRK